MSHKKEKYSFDELKQRCTGRWVDILGSLSGVDLSEAIATRKHVRCHQDHGRTKSQFRLFSDFDETGGGVCNTCGPFSDGFAMLRYLNGWTYKEAVKNVAEYLGNDTLKPQTPSTRTVKSTPREFVLDEDAADNLRKVWKGGKAIKGTVVEDYLRKRGITAQLPDETNVRFHPRLHYWDADSETSLGYHPGMISLLRSSRSGHPLSVHRTFLTSNGTKANVPRVKKLMACSIDGAISQLGAAIRLYDIEGPVIGICEGIETGFALRSAFPTLPVWAAYSANVLTNFHPPEGVKKVVIFGDVDASGTGQVAAGKLALRLRSNGFDATVALPRNAVSLPDEENSGWYGTGSSRDDVASLLTNDGYTLTKTCDSMDWLDRWNEEPDGVRLALQT